MTDTKKLTKPQKTNLLKLALKRLPSSRLVNCKYCFSPRNTLTVKAHLESTWFVDEIEAIENGVNIPCKGCKNSRFLSLSSISLNFFLQDLSSGEFKSFVLLKDDRFNSLIGFQPFDKVIDLKAEGFATK